MQGFEILIGREHIDPRLPMVVDPSIARVMGHLARCVCFAGMSDGKNVAVCLLDEQADGVCDIVNLAVDSEHAQDGLESKLLLYVMDYARSKGFGYLEIGVGNAHVDMHKTIMKVGFRVIGVIPDYYQSDVRGLVVENSIVNRDMLRYRVDFNDGWVTWTEEVK